MIVSLSAKILLDLDRFDCEYQRCSRLTVEHREYFKLTIDFILTTIKEHTYVSATLLLHH